MTGHAEEDVTDRIRAAAVAMFAEAGYGSTNIEQIASAAGVGVGSLYRRWPDKAALANDLIASIIEEMSPLYEPVVAPHAKQRFLAVWHRIWAYATENPERFLLLEGNVNAPFLSKENAAGKAALEVRAKRLLDDLGVRAGVELASAIVVGTTVALLRADVDATPDEVGERLWHALRVSYG